MGIVVMYARAVVSMNMCRGIGDLALPFSRLVVC